MAVKEIQLSNIPKGELGQIMVRILRWLPLAFYEPHSKSLSFQSEIDLLKNLNVCHL